MARSSPAMTAGPMGHPLRDLGVTGRRHRNPVLTGRLHDCRRAHNMEFIRQQNDIARDAYCKTHGAPLPMALADPDSFAFDDRAWITDCSVGLLVSPWPAPQPILFRATLACTAGCRADGLVTLAALGPMLFRNASMILTTLVGDGIQARWIADNAIGSNARGIEFLISAST
jgi:hypothetical protein